MGVALRLGRCARGWARVLTAALALWAALAGCGPRPERVLRLIYAQTPQSLDPQRHREDVTRHVLAHFYEPLVATGPGLELQPALAERWETPSDRTWRLRLRSGVRFHDGTPFGAPDVLRTLERAGRPPSRVADRVRGLGRVVALDERTVEIETLEPAPLLLARLASLPILPRSTGPDDVVRPVGTGPYRFVSASGDLASIEVERFEGYWGEAPAFGRARLEVVTDDERRWTEAGSADVASPLPADARSQAGLRVLSHPIVTAAFVVCRLSPLSGGRASPVASLRVRQALDRALDRRRLVEVGLAGAGVPLAQLVVAGVAGHLGQPPPRGADLAEARELLRSAGGPPALPLELQVTPRRRAVGEELARQWAQVGVKIEVRARPWNEIDASMRAGRTVLALAALTYSDGDAAGMFEEVLHSPQGGGGLGGGNTSGYARPEFDQVVREASREMDPGRRQSLLARAAGLALEDLPLIPLYQPSWTYAVREDLAFQPRLDFAVTAQALRPRVAPR